MYTDTHCPPVVLGYGESVWRQNVAMVQSSQSDLNRIFRAALDMDHHMGAYTVDDKPGTDALTSSATTAVDGDFGALLSDGLPTAL